MSTKTKIQSRIEKCESELATLKADLAKCDCAEGIEKEKCWHAININSDGVRTLWGGTKSSIENAYPIERPAYMPECRQVTAEDAFSASSAYVFTETAEEAALALHKLGFRMKVTP